MANQHVVPNNGKWSVKGEHNSKATKTFDRQSDAISYGRTVATNQSGELVIHGRDGRIRNKNSFGNDPHPPKDKVH